MQNHLEAIFVARARCFTFRLEGRNCSERRSGTDGRHSRFTSRLTKSRKCKFHSRGSQLALDQSRVISSGSKQRRTSARKKNVRCITCTSAESGRFVRFITALITLNQCIIYGVVARVDHHCKTPNYPRRKAPPMFFVISISRGCRKLRRPRI